MKTRQMPNDYEAEVTLLGTCLINKNKAPDILNQLNVDDFYDNRNKVILKTMLDLHNKNRPIDVVTITSLLTDRNKLNDAGGIDYLFELSEAVPTIAHTDYYIEMLKEKTKLRRIIEISSNAAENAMNVPDDVNAFIDTLERDLLGVTRNSSNARAKNTRDIVNVVTEKLLRIKGNQEIIGLPSGYKELDQLTLGFQNGNLIILAARPSMGKTAFALNIISNNPSKRCLIFSLEMSAELLIQRFLSSVGKMASKPLKNGTSIKFAKERYYAAAQKVAEMNVIIDDDSSNTINDIIAKCRKENADEKLDLIVIDYLQLINGVSKGDRQQQISEFSRKLKLLARELDVPIICLSQLSREVEKRQDKHPMMSDLRESGAIEQDADIVLFLYRDSYYRNGESPEIDETEVIVSKNRDGATGVGKVAFEKMFGRFSDIKEDTKKVA